VVAALARQNVNLLQPTRIAFVDSHTEGEPTRLVFDGAPLLPSTSSQHVATAAQQRDQLRQHDWFRQLVVLEPRGHEAIVGAVLLPASNKQCVAGVVFINNTGYLGMCGHGLIGVAVSLHHLGRIPLGTHQIETPVGIVHVHLRSANEAAITNVPSHRSQKQVAVHVNGYGAVVGDVAWGGNWFFLVNDPPCALAVPNLRQLIDTADAIRNALLQAGIRGDDGAPIDHIEFFSAAADPKANSRNFVYCPGGAYDRSPCGTGTSAKLACLASDGKLDEGSIWVQESIIGSRFEATFQRGQNGAILPTIIGRAYVCSEGTLVSQPDDPFRWGIAATASTDPLTATGGPT
jgi:4-hydroxyproline epimerase